MVAQYRYEGKECGLVDPTRGGTSAPIVFHKAGESKCTPKPPSQPSPRDMFIRVTLIAGLLNFICTGQASIRHSWHRRQVNSDRHLASGDGGPDSIETSKSSNLRAQGTNNGEQHHVSGFESSTAQLLQTEQAEQQPRARAEAHAEASSRYSPQKVLKQRSSSLVSGGHALINEI